MSVRRTAALLTAAAALVLLPAAPAAAHDYLVSSTPAAGSTVTRAPDSVSLTFDEAVLDLGRGSDGVVVTSSSGRHFETGCASVHGDVVSVPVALGAAGGYTVTWRVVSADGHPVGDSIRFEYRPATGTVTAAGSAHAPDCGVRVVPGGGSAAGSGGVVLVVVLVAGVVGVLLLAALIVTLIVLRRAGRPDADADASDGTSDGDGSPDG